MLDGLTSFVKAKRNSGKRVCFDIIHLDEWLKWADRNGFLFTNTENGVVDGVVVIYPVGKFDKVPTLGQVLGRCGYKDTPTDYFIMDALIDNPLARSKICVNIFQKFPLIENDPSCQMWCQKGDKIIKLSKNHIINLKHNG